MSFNVIQYHSMSSCSVSKGRYSPPALAMILGSKVHSAIRNKLGGSAFLCRLLDTLRHRVSGINMDQYGSIWINMDQYGSIWINCI